MIVWLAIAAVLLAVPFVDFVRRADLRRVATRNITRRLGEASLVIFGSLLGTAIIAAAFIVGDSFDYSIRDIARTNLGPVDEIVVLSDQDDLATAMAALADPIDGVDGLLSMNVTRASLATPEGDGRLAEPNAGVATLDFDDARAFGAHPEITGLIEAGETPQNGEVVINADLADELKVQVGDQLEMFAYGQELPLVVTAVVPVEGLGGQNDAYVAPGTLQTLYDDFTSDLATPPESLILISNDGAIFDSTNGSYRIESAVQDRLDGTGIDYQSAVVKQDLLEDAEQEGAELTEIFSVIGGFSVIAGVLLLINLFVMLAEERKTTLGVLRAVGWRRSTLVRSFALEGAIYAIVASVAGALLGIVVGWVIITYTSGILEGDLDMFLSVEIGSLVTAGAVGLVISLLAIWGTSVRISRLNIIAAIRDLPNASSRKSRMTKDIIGAVLIVLGAAVFALLGLGGESIIPALVGPPLVVLGIALLLERWVSADRRILGAGTLTIIWGALSMVVLPDSMTSDVEMPFFLFLGLVMVAGGVAVATTAGPMLRRVLDYSSEPRVAARVGMAYPLAQRFRTAISLAAFTLVIFSMVFIAVMSRGFSNQVADFTADGNLGQDILLSTNGSSPLETQQLLAIDGVESVSPMVRGFAEFSAPHNPDSLDSPEFWRLTGATEELARFGSPALEARSGDYATDAAAFQAVAQDPSLAIVPDWFLGGGDGDPSAAVGDVFQLMSADGSSHDLTIVGLVDFDVIGAGVWMNEGLIRAELPEFSSQTKYLLTTDGSASDSDIAASIQGAFVSYGADAESIQDRVQGYVDQDTAFFKLLNGYLALGLVIGIAGLGVILVRAIRERRRQIGMFRAMGMPRAGVRTTFLTEGVFVSMLAVFTGVSLGLLVANLLLTQSSAVGDGSGGALPWSNVIIISGFTLVAALFVAAIPAMQAARLRPSEALRLAD